MFEKNRKTNRLFLSVLAASQVLYGFPVHVGAENQKITEQQYQQAVEQGLAYLKASQLENGVWNRDALHDTSDIAEKIGFVGEETGKGTEEVLELAMNYGDGLELNNTDEYVQYLQMMDTEESLYEAEYLADLQNEDGGYGLDYGYESDVLDTKQALKMLNRWQEEDAGTGAGRYLLEQQEEDGGFAYQPGGKSHPLLSAETAAVLAEAAAQFGGLQTDFQEKGQKLEAYLEGIRPSVESLSENDLNSVYQYLYTSLFAQKRKGFCETASLYALQQKDGSLFQDPLATALFLELIVREHQYIPAEIRRFELTDAKGKNTAVFNRDSEIRILLETGTDPERAETILQLEAPDGTVTLLDPESQSWNTKDAAEGTWWMTAKLQSRETKKTLQKSTRSFQIDHRLEVEELFLSLSQPYAGIGDDTEVEVTAQTVLKNVSDSREGLSLQWEVSSNGNRLASGTEAVTGEQAAQGAVRLGTFRPDTTEPVTYIVTAKLMEKDLVLAQTSLNFFVSAKDMLLKRSVDKEVLTEAEDQARVTVEVQEEKEADLIFTTSSQDTGLITRYAQQIENIRAELEGLGYRVNTSNVSTSFLSAKDTFAWEEYDHPEYKDVHVEDLPKHIVYNEDSISMLGYGRQPFKDFLLVSDDNPSRKILEFDLQRDDSTDWHTLDGGGFLFNTSIQEDGTFSGYCAILGDRYLQLIRLEGVELEKFRNGSYNTVSKAGKVLKKIRIGDLRTPHHITIEADPDHVSLWDGDTRLLKDYPLPKRQPGNGYGPITSYKWHDCKVRSSFTFSNITMKTVTGERLSDILAHYRFGSCDNRYVIHLSDLPAEELDTAEEAEAMAEKIQNRRISFFALGNESNRKAYENLTKLLEGRGAYADYAAGEKEQSLQKGILRMEKENSMEKAEEITATRLRLTGVLPDGSSYVKERDSLIRGEKWQVEIFAEMKELTAGRDAQVLRDIRLEYLDEAGRKREKRAEDVALPVQAPADKITSRMRTERPAYAGGEEVLLIQRIQNRSKKRSAGPLTALVTITGPEGVRIGEFQSELAGVPASEQKEIVTGWNTKDLPAGIYTVTGTVLEGGRILSTDSMELTIREPVQKELLFSGQLQADRPEYKREEPVQLSLQLANPQAEEIRDAQVLVRIVDVAAGRPVYEKEMQCSLGAGGRLEELLKIVPAQEFSGLAERESYLACAYQKTAAGEEVLLAEGGFVLAQTGEAKKRSFDLQENDYKSASRIAGDTYGESKWEGVTPYGPLFGHMVNYGEDTRPPGPENGGIGFGWGDKDWMTGYVMADTTAFAPELGEGMYRDSYGLATLGIVRVDDKYHRFDGFASWEEDLSEALRQYNGNAGFGKAGWGRPDVYQATGLVVWDGYERIRATEPGAFRGEEKEYIGGVKDITSRTTKERQNFVRYLRKELKNGAKLHGFLTTAEGVSHLYVPSASRYRNGKGQIRKVPQIKLTGLTYEVRIRHTDLPAGVLLPSLLEQPAGRKLQLPVVEGYQAEWTDEQGQPVSAEAPADRCMTLQARWKKR